MIYKFLFYLILILLFTIFIAVNNKPIELNLIFKKIEIPLFLFALISFLVGFIFSFILLFKIILKKRKQIPKKDEVH
jgi:uncharacterized integral membrane protein